MKVVSNPSTSAQEIAMTPLRQRMIDDMTLHGSKGEAMTAYVACIARWICWRIESDIWSYSGWQ
jgi:hypothetical protein